MAACAAPEWDEAAGLSGQGEPLSEGSRHHRLGRCKPCAFFHTKGCQNGPACLFCHQCPPFEAQRRQRVRRQLLRPVFGHARQVSDASTASSAGCGSQRFSHSRQSSGASSCSGSEEPFAPSPIRSAAAAASAATREDGRLLAGPGQPLSLASGLPPVQNFLAAGTPRAPPVSGGAACGAVQYMLVPVPAPPQQQELGMGLSMPVPWIPSDALYSSRHDQEQWESGYDSPATAAGY
mmetsp:Transcript_97028/g.257806  ORF Transcript_97028/g.257806 Transcript_97028/m.257806 type:complete len:236 (-) Transcript_97028:164-871(-)